MRAEEFTGNDMKVVILGSVGLYDNLDDAINNNSLSSLNTCARNIKKQGYAYIRETDDKMIYEACDNIEYNATWDVYLEDIEPYIEQVTDVRETTVEEESLLDKVFKTHNEITTRDGMKYICINDYIAYNADDYAITKDDFNLYLISKYEDCQCISEVVNPFTKEIIYEREKELDYTTLKDEDLVEVSDDGENWEIAKFAIYLPKAEFKFYVYNNGSREESNTLDEYKYCRLPK